MSTERFTTNEAAERLGISPARVRQMVTKGEIASEKFGRDTVITSEALAAAMTRKTKPGPAPKAKPEAAPASATNGTAKRTEVTAAKKRAAQKTTT
jgi:excisionase family DNA binding protein